MQALKKINDHPFTPRVKSLLGSFKMPKNCSLDYKKEITEALEEKYCVVSPLGGFVMVKTLEQLMNADVHNIEDLNNVMKLENDDYPVDAVDFETPPELEKYKTKWQDYKKFCI